jgi:hypothetical protein
MASNKNGVFIEAPHTSLGLAKLRTERYVDGRFKNCRILMILQAKPSEVEVYVVHPIM